MVELFALLNICWLVFTLAITTALISIKEPYSIIDLLFYTYLLLTGIVLAANSIVLAI